MTSMHVYVHICIDDVGVHMYMHFSILILFICKYAKYEWVSICFYTTLRIQMMVNDGTSEQYAVKFRLLTSENKVNDNINEDHSQEVDSSHIFRTRALQHLMYGIQLILVSISSFILYCICHLNHV